MEMTREDNYENQNPAKRVSSLTLCSSKGNNDAFKPKNCMFSIFKCQQHIHYLVCIYKTIYILYTFQTIYLKYEHNHIKKKKDNDSIWYLQVLQQSSHGFIFTLN